MPEPKKIEKADKLVSRIMKFFALCVFIATGSYMSFFDGVDHFREFFDGPKHDRIQDSLIIELEYQTLLKEYSQEMFWEFASLITDDDDTLDWYFVDDAGHVYDVDIRATAEDIELAFVFDVHIIYPVYFAPARNRRYIMVHDYRNAKKQNYYLYKK